MNKMTQNKRNVLKKIIMMICSWIIVTLLLGLNYLLLDWLGEIDRLKAIGLF